MLDAIGMFVTSIASSRDGYYARTLSLSTSLLQCLQYCDDCSERWETDDMLVVAEYVDDVSK
jgi:hypothetical protein